jgi:uncharacterized membrane protein YfcA
MIDDPWFYAAAIPAMIVLGIAKGGFGAIGLLVVPILAVVISPVQAAGITLPILILSDFVAVASYWGAWDRRVLAIMLPGALIGIAIGWLTAAWVTEQEIRLILGVVSVAFALNYWFRHRLNPLPREPDVVKGTFWAAITGFTSFVSHAGGPPYQIFVVPLRLPPRIFAGTLVIFFFILNSVKLAPYFFLGQFNAENLLTSAVLLPVSIPATLFSVWLVKRIDPMKFYQAVYALIFLVGLFLVFQSIAELIRPAGPAT